MEGPEKLKLIEIEFSRRKRDTITAYFLCILFWFAGVHKFYIGKTLEGIIYIILFPLGAFMTVFGFFSISDTILYTGLSALAILGCFIIYDIITLWKQVDKSNEKLYREIYEKIKGEPYNITNEIQ